MKTGVHEITQKAYHADPCAAPSLSCSIGKIMLNQSPRHAWTAHPRLNPDYEVEEKTQFDLGAAAHTMVLGSGEKIVPVYEKDWRKNAAKEQRDAARAEGKIPVLGTEMSEIKIMAAAAAAQLANHKDAHAAFERGIPERAIVWQETTDHGTIWCRALIDYLPDERDRDIFDYKSTGTSANPDHFHRMIFDMGYDFQAAFYTRGLRAVADWTGRNFCFVVQENKAPYALSVIGLGPEALALADRKVTMAIQEWGWCMAQDTWPGYPQETCWVEPPVYHSIRWEDRQSREEIQRNADGAEAVYRSAMDWQRPL